MPPIDAAALHPGQDGPVEEPFAFGALTHREALPVLGAQLVSDAAHIAEHGAVTRLHADDFDRGNRQRVGGAVLLQEEAQVRAMPVDRIGHHPTTGHPR